jgi:predicted nucleic acid-binding protein
VLGRNKRLTATRYARSLEVVPVEWELVPQAIAIHRRYQKHYYDALHLAAASRNGCEELWSEDIGFDGEVIAGVRVRNPFRIP